MAVLTSQLDREAEEFTRRRERMEALLAEVRERTAQVARGGGEKAWSGTARAASCPPGSGSTGWSTPARPFSS